MLIREIGCCGAYCKTCLPSIEAGVCHSCKLGYDEGKRDINKSRCKIKICCFRERQLETCADCNAYQSCELIQGFYNKNGYKYKKYRQSIDFIREHGYDKFMNIADSWKRAYGKLG